MEILFKIMIDETIGLDGPSDFVRVVRARRHIKSPRSTLNGS